ncbi:hypothetical protein EIP86_011189 [Pleurotus ostreatoroseus]|nr:hypothetical protein EIP86_011189 [Pleurotus ostreatoroseus]
MLRKNEAIKTVVFEENMWQERPQAGTAHGLPQYMRLLKTIRTQTLPAFRICIAKPSQNVTPPKPSPERLKQPVYASTVPKFLTSLRRLILDRQSARASETFHHVMRVRFQSRDRHGVFVAATKLFLKYGHAREALQVYSYMTLEGLIPPTKLKAAMYVIRRTTSDPIPSVDTVVAAVQTVVKDKSFDHVCLLFLINQLVRIYHVPDNAIERIIQAFLLSRPQNSTLSSEAQVYITYIRTRFLPDSIDVPPFSLRTVRDHKWKPQGTPRAKPLPPSHHRLARYFKRRDLKGGLQLYRRFMERNPKGSTVLFFTVLLRTITKITESRLRTDSIRVSATEMPSLRELYRDIWQVHYRLTNNSPRRRSSVLNATILNKFISSFTRCEDYAAAFVALRALRLCNLPVSLDTYKSVLSPLFDRIQVELLADSSSAEDLTEEDVYLKESWALRFLGHPDYANLRVDVNMVDAILHVGEDAEAALDPLAWTPEEREAMIAQKLPWEKRYVMPTASQLIGLEPPTHKIFNSTPLHRILRRAILAVPRKIFLSPAIFLSKMLRDAKQEMLPRVHR